MLRFRFVEGVAAKMALTLVLRESLEKGCSIGNAMAKSIAMKNSMLSLGKVFSRLFPRRPACALGLALLAGGVCAAPAFAQEDSPTVYPAPTSWSEVYNPGVLLGLNVRLAAADYATIRADETFDIKVPAVFWVDNVTPDPGSWNITIRRKSATPIGEKISYRIALESKIGGGSSRWLNIKSFSLENGDDQDVVSEGLAWFLHRQAWAGDCQPGLAAWTTLTLHVVGEDGTVDVRPQGVYLNVELPDKRFLQNRGLWTSSSTSWLYKQDDIGLPELKEWPNDSTGPESDSPAYRALSYQPFQPAVVVRKRVQNLPPADAQLETDLSYWINMPSMLRLGAVNAFTANPDELFNHGKNFFWADFGDTALNHAPRLYFPWDLDAAIRSPNASIYGTVSGSGRKATVKQHAYQSVILNHPTFRVQYNGIMAKLLQGPLAVDGVQDFLNGAQALLTDALLADPNNQIGSSAAAIADHFDTLRAWIVLRHSSVNSQLKANGPPAPRN
jgi:hypothetical protein